MFEHNGKAKIREATVAGIFYPEGGQDLEREVRTLLDAAQPIVSGAAAIVAPHAGLNYSGDLAALAWKAAVGRPVRSVVILAPQHRAEESLIYLPESELYQTPLGPVPVDRALVEELRDCGTIFSVNDIPHFQEHGIEVQLPFMRLLFPEASLVPIILGKPSVASVKTLAASLGLVFGERLGEILVVLTTDLATGSDTGTAARSKRFLGLMESGDWKAMLEAGPKDEPTACGSGCVAAFLASPLAARTTAVLLGRHDSSRSRESGEERLVHYAALAFVRAS